jgi:hypothetical protein
MVDRPTLGDYASEEDGMGFTALAREPKTYPQLDIIPGGFK